MDSVELGQVVSALRGEGSDTAQIEVKRAAGGFPQSILPTISAFANTPGGGTILFGLDEAEGFRAVGVEDVAACKSAFASRARQAVTPPVQCTLTDVLFEGVTIVVARVHELATHEKPCRVTSSRKAYLRSYDGDYELSQLDEQSLLANRGVSAHDREAVPGTSWEDVRPLLGRHYLDSCRASSPSLATMTDEDVLYRTGVTVSRSGPLTVAGLLALGAFPQQHLPNCVIQASVAPRAGDPPGTRAADVRRFDGPIPVMLDEAQRWVRRNTGTRVRSFRDGSVRDEPEYPPEVVRELLSNALIHRDVGPYAQTRAITLTVQAQQLQLSNPGGLWGISIDRLGHEGVTSARNGHLLRICQNVRTASGDRVVEALATGIPQVLASLEAAGMVPPRFIDQGVGFTVLVPNHSLLAEEDIEWVAALPGARLLDERQRHALVEMRHGRRWTSGAFQRAFAADLRQVGAGLEGLVHAGLASTSEQDGRIVYQAAGPAARDAAATSPTEDSPVDVVLGGSRERNAAALEAALAQGAASAVSVKSNETGVSVALASWWVRWSWWWWAG